MFTLLKSIDRNEKLESIDLIGYAYNAMVGDGDYEAEVEIPYPYCNDDELMTNVNDMLSKGTRCACCNRNIKYIVFGAKDDDIIPMGSDCSTLFGLDNRSKSILDSLDKSSLQSKKRVANYNIRQKFLEKYDGLEEVLEVNNKIINDIRRSFIRYNNISEKQVELVFKMADIQKKMGIQKAKNEKITFTELVDTTVIVKSAKKVINGYGVEVTKLVLTNKAVDGWALYGNLTKGVENINIGDKIVMSCKSITVSDNDESFGFFKRAKFKSVF